MQIDKIVMSVKKIKNSTSKSQRGGGMFLHKLQPVHNKKWAADLIRFLEGDSLFKPSKIIELFHKSSSHLSKEVKRHDHLKHLHPHIQEYAGIIKSAISEVKHVKQEISHLKHLNNKNQSGSGNKQCGRGFLKKTFKNVVEFLKGNKKTKPWDVLRGIGYVSGAVAAATRAMKLDGVTVVFDKINKSSMATADYLQKAVKGSGRLLEGGSKHKKGCGKKCDSNPAKSVCRGSGKKGGALKPGGGLVPGGSLTAGGGQLHKVGTMSGNGVDRNYWFKINEVKARSGQAYKDCKKSLRNEGYRKPRQIRNKCKDAVLNFGVNAANYKGDNYAMAERIVKRVKGLE